VVAKPTLPPATESNDLNWAFPLLPFSVLLVRSQHGLTMAEKENQHFVPQYYFRFYSKDQKSISLLNTHSGKTVKTAPIKGQASKSYFYGTAEAENLITEVETSFIGTLKKIKNEKTFSALNEEETLNILQAFMFQRSRTLSRRKDSKNQQNYMARAMAEIAINTSKDLGESQREELRSFLDFIVADPIPFQSLDMSISISNAHELMDINKIILKNRTKNPFIFSDAPALLINPMQKRVLTHGVLGMRTPGIIALLPLSPRTAIMLYDKRSYKIQSESKGSLCLKKISDVDELNKLQVCSAASTVYFDDYDFAPYVSKLLNETKKHIGKPPKIIVQEGTLLDNGEEKEIVHFFEKQLPISPKLSFMKYSEVDPQSYLIDRSLWNGRSYF
jgi:hypothetical protein